MGSIAKRPSGQWRARYRDAAGKEHSRHFDRKIDAQAWLDSVTTARATGTYADPNRAKVTVAAWAPQWLAGQTHLKPSTHERYAGIIREHMIPHWSAVKLSDITHSDIQAWIVRISSRRSAATVRKVHRVFSLMLKTAVRDGRLSRNPADAINLPRVVASELRYLSHDQVRRLAELCEPYRLVVLFLAYTGVRFGEMAALRVNRVDLPRRRAIIAESVVVVRGVQIWGTPKGHERREVPIPLFIADELVGILESKSSTDLVFPAFKGGALRSQGFQRAVLTSAAKRLGLPGLHPHELRHTAASLAIASGASVKVVQQMLGHKTATMTLDLYGHLYADQLDEIGDRLNEAAERAAERSRATEDEPTDAS